MQGYRDMGLGNVPDNMLSLAQQMGAPASADWREDITAFTAASSMYGWKVFLPANGAGQLLGLAWDKSWRLVPYSAIPLPPYPDKIVQGVQGTPFIEGAQAGAPSYYTPVTHTPPYPAPPGQQWIWDNDTQSYKLSALGVTVDVQAMIDARQHATESLADMLSEISAFQGSAESAARAAARDLNYAGAIENTIATVASKLNAIITSGAAELQAIRSKWSDVWTADGKETDATKFKSDLAAGVQAFNDALAKWSKQRDDAAKAALYAIQSDLPHPAQVPPGTPPPSDVPPSGFMPTPSEPPTGETTTEPAPMGMASLPMVLGLGLLGALIVRGMKKR